LKISTYLSLYIVNVLVFSCSFNTNRPGG